MVYYIIFIFSGILSFVAELKYKKIICIILAIILSLFAGSRIGIDRDYYLYLKNFRYVEPTFSVFLEKNHLEWCMFFIPDFFRQFYNSNMDVAKACFVFFATLGVSLKIIAIEKYSEYIFLSVILYFGNLFLMHEMTTIRAGIAAGFFLLSIKNIEQKEHLQFFIKLLLCFFFHSSSVLYILPWMFYTFRVPIKYYYYTIIISIVLVVLNINLITILMLDKIFPKVEYYIKAMEWMKDGKVNILNFKMLFAMIIVAIFSMFYSTLKERFIYFDLLFKIHIISICLFLILSVSGAQVFSTRAFEMYSVVQILLYPMIVHIFPDKMKIIGWALIIVFSCIQTFYLIDVADIFKAYDSWL
ncbi:EpsG family protein [Chryseobacterium nematophagum]|uniref:EpsG family protein n=1 Tax=Chryseobacterium nematophagum TaxID=2305228 RepID=A0A3M7TEF8_9FLAO|nr:EpsG family protein [Chryseobacterium nematophagum]RNA61688.1 EpsG family protein [Chryseobacterium nematophagum]